MVMEGSVFTGQLVNHARELECPRTCTFKGFTPPNGPENFIGLIPHRSPATQFSLVAGGPKLQRSYAESDSCRNAENHSDSRPPIDWCCLIVVKLLRLHKIMYCSVAPIWNPRCYQIGRNTTIYCLLPSFGWSSLGCVGMLIMFPEWSLLKSGWDDLWTMNA